MATEATFTIRQVEPNQPEVATAEPPAEVAEKPEQRKSVRRKRKKDKEEKKKTKKPPGITFYLKIPLLLSCDSIN